MFPPDRHGLTVGGMDGWMDRRTDKRKERRKKAVCRVASMRLKGFNFPTPHGDAAGIKTGSTQAQAIITIAWKNRKFFVKLNFENELIDPG